MLVFKAFLILLFPSLPPPPVRSLSVKWFELKMKYPNPCSGKASVCLTGSSEEEEHCNDFSSGVDHWAQTRRYGCIYFQWIFWNLKLKPYLKPHVPALPHSISVCWWKTGGPFQCRVYSSKLMLLLAGCSRESRPPQKPEPGTLPEHPLRPGKPLQPLGIKGIHKQISISTHVICTMHHRREKINCMSHCCPN